MTEQTTTKAKPGAVVIGFLVLLVGEVLILWNAGVTVPTVLPKNIGTFHHVDKLFWLIFWVTGFFFLLTEGMLIYFCLRFRARAGEGKGVHTHGSHGIELAWTFIPGAILFGLAVIQTSAWAEMKYVGSFPAEKDSVVIQVYAKQFEWHTRYSGPDREFGTADDVTKLGELHVPVDRDIIVKLRTRDVLHSFWLVNVRV